jgi:hypothetical protein
MVWLIIIILSPTGLRSQLIAIALKRIDTSLTGPDWEQGGRYFCKDSHI